MHYRKPTEAQLPPKAAPEHHWPAEPTVLRAPIAAANGRPPRQYRSKYVIVDSDRHIKDDAERLMVVCDQFGVVVCKSPCPLALCVLCT